MNAKKLVFNDRVITNPSDVLAAFRQHFESLATSNSSDTNSERKMEDLEALSYLQNEEILDTEITMEEIAGALKSLKPGRSNGADGLSAEHLYHGGISIRRWLLKIFNQIIQFEDLPACLKGGITIPIYKGNGKDPLVPGSYRGITLSSVIAKPSRLSFFNVFTLL